MKKITIRLLLVSITLSLFSYSATAQDHNSGEFHNKKKEMNNSEENDAKIVELGEFLDNAIYTQDIDGYLSKMDFDYFVNKTTHRVGFSSNEKKGFKKGLKSGIASLPREISNKVQNGELYDFISYRYDSNEKTYFMLFRFFSEEEGINYHDYMVSKNGKDIMFNDIYIYLTGENLTQTMERIVLTGLPSSNLNTILKPDVRKDFDKLLSATKAIKTGNYQDAYDTYNSMESDMKTEKAVLIIKAQVASKINEALYEKTIIELMKAHPTDNTISLNYIDYYIIKENYTKTLEMINELRNESEDDFLEYLIGNVNYLKGDYDLAKSNFKYIMENYEGFSTAYLSYMGCLVLDKEYDKIIPVLNSLISQGYTKDELIDYLESEDELGGNEYADFIESKEYLNWKK